MMPLPKAVVFDLDNTLYLYSPCDSAGRNAVYNYLNDFYTIPFESFSTLYIECDKAVKEANPLTAAGHNRILFYHRMCELLNLPSDTHAIPMYNAYWSAYINKMEIFPGAFELLKKLKAKGVSLGLCSDLTLHIQLRKIQKLGLQGVFDKITVSEEVGADKPSPLMFHSILQKLSTSPSEAIMVGDNDSRDIEGALNVGMEGILFGEIRNGRRCARNFTELTELLFGKS